ncbi:MAG: tyrosine-protein kinase Etk/Wzc, partial [Gammaproteobacteria bacterium]
MEEDFELKETGSFFDFKGFLFKVISLWPLFILTLGVAYAVAYYNNVRKVPVYRSSNLISIKDDQNPLFTGN